MKERADLHYGDVLQHPALTELRVMFVGYGPRASSPIGRGQEVYITAVVLSDSRSPSLDRWVIGDVRDDLAWGTGCPVIEKGDE